VRRFAPAEFEDNNMIDTKGTTVFFQHAPSFSPTASKRFSGEAPGAGAGQSRAGLTSARSVLSRLVRKAARWL